ncbi:protein DEK-like [Tubulanus polymorphus]|uniref:protein DEK-like n=1 Tax=Tubulanus polymorphus TaxID=672921 RepID=UPI003DA59324
MSEADKTPVSTAEKAINENGDDSISKKDMVKSSEPETVVAEMHTDTEKKNENGKNNDIEEDMETEEDEKKQITPTTNDKQASPVKETAVTPPVTPKKKESVVKEDAISPSKSEDAVSPQKSVKDESEEEDELKPGLLERPFVIEGSSKRERKKTERLAMTDAFNTPAEKQLEIPEGTGEKIGSMPRVEFFLSKANVDDCKLLHRFFFGRVGQATVVRRNIRKFCGFTFTKGSAEWEKKYAILMKMTRPQLRAMRNILDVECGKAKEDDVANILEFSINPKASGKALPDKSKKGRKSKTKSGSKKSTKKKAGKKKETKASDSEDGEDDEGDEDSDGKQSEDEEENEDATADSEEEKQESEEASESEEEKPKKKKKKAQPKKKKETAKKAKKTPAKKEKPAKEKKPSKKRKAPESDDESDSDDEPVAKKKKGPPTNAEIKSAIKKILEGVNFDEVTMKTVCKQVYAKFPDFDLTDRKVFIKSTVKELIS